MSSFDEQFVSNLAFLSGFGGGLDQLLVAAKASLVFQQSEYWVSLSVDGEIWLDDVQRALDQSLNVQLESTDRVRFQRVRAGRSPLPTAQILGDLVDTEDLVVLDQLPNLQASLLVNDQTTAPDPIVRAAVLLGALSLGYVRALVEHSRPFDSFLLVETDARQFAAVLHLVDLVSLVDELKAVDIGFDLIFQPDGDALGARLLDKLGSSNPLAIQGFWLYRSPQLSPPLIELHSWCHGSDGLLDHAKGFLGNDTDEFNQVMHASWNSLLYPKASLLKADVLPSDHPVLIVASGPSLDQQLPWLTTVHQHFTIIAAGSALGALLRAGVHVDACVLLEMASLVYRDVSDLQLEGFSLAEIVLIGSVTLDPRLAAQFQHHCFFHRPLSAAFALADDEQGAVLPQAGPQAANAALEVALQLGSRKLLLLGCDFAAVDPDYPRAAGAMGSSPRDFTLPVRGNLGRTVSSSPELSTTRQLFENMIRLYGPEAVAVGEGSWIDGVEAMAEANPDDLMARYGSDPQRFRAAFETLPQRAVRVDLLIERLQQASAWGEQRSAEIAAYLSACKGWSHTVAKKLGELVSWEDQQLEPAQRLRHRLTRFLYFMAFQPLHDSRSTEEFGLRVAQLRPTFDQIDAVYRAYFATLVQVASAKQLPGWDAQWMRQLLKRYTEV